MLKRFLPSLLLIALPASGDSILAQVDVPNSLVPQGEVRLVERGTEVVVQTVIKTSHPGIVCRKITEKERRNWPGNAEMESYIATLEAAFAECGKRGRDTSLFIDFVAGPGGTRVDFSFPPDAAWRSLPLSAAYVKKNQEYILADSFGKKSGDLIQTLRKLNPMDVPHE